jgi:hypothetical protein
MNIKDECRSYAKRELEPHKEFETLNRAILRSLERDDTVVLWGPTPSQGEVEVKGDVVLFVCPEVKHSVKTSGNVYLIRCTQHAGVVSGADVYSDGFSQSQNVSAKGKFEVFVNRNSIATSAYSTWLSQKETVLRFISEHRSGALSHERLLETEILEALERPLSTMILSVMPSGGSVLVSASNVIGPYESKDMSTDSDALCVSCSNITSVLQFGENAYLLGCRQHKSIVAQNIWCDDSSQLSDLYATKSLRVFQRETKEIVFRDQKFTCPVTVYAERVILVRCTGQEITNKSATAESRLTLVDTEIDHSGFGDVVKTNFGLWSALQSQ